MFKCGVKCGGACAKIRGQEEEDKLRIKYVRYTRTGWLKSCMFNAMC